MKKKLAKDAVEELKSEFRELVKTTYHEVQFPSILLNKALPQTYQIGVKWEEGDEACVDAFDIEMLRSDYLDYWRDLEKKFYKQIDKVCKIKSNHIRAFLKKTGKVCKEYDLDYDEIWEEIVENAVDDM